MSVLRKGVREQEAVLQASHAATTNHDSHIANSQLLLRCYHNMFRQVANAEMHTFSNGMLPIEHFTHTCCVSYKHIALAQKPGAMYWAIHSHAVCGDFDEALRHEAKGVANVGDHPRARWQWQLPVCCTMECCLVCLAHNMPCIGFWQLLVLTTVEV